MGVINLHRALTSSGRGSILLCDSGLARNVSRRGRSQASAARAVQGDGSTGRNISAVSVLDGDDLVLSQGSVLLQAGRQVGNLDLVVHSGGLDGSASGGGVDQGDYCLEGFVRDNALAGLISNQCQVLTLNPKRHTERPLDPD